jgi:hypothetical protein
MPCRTEHMHIELGQWTEETLDHLLWKAASIEKIGARIAFISTQFLDIPYRESTLTGNRNTREIFTINLEAVDCFTYLDYVEAMRLSASFTGFKKNLREIRYRAGKVAYTHRNHFFTDWRERHFSVTDVTGEIGQGRAQAVLKRLNEKQDGTYFIPGIPVMERDITYIPAEALDGAVLTLLQLGDYVGIYAGTAGLDVSHVGIFIKGNNANYLRHASSAPSQKKVIDQDFKTYMEDKPGIVVLRPKAWHKAEKPPQPCGG